MRQRGQTNCWPVWRFRLPAKRRQPIGDRGPWTWAIARGAALRQHIYAQLNNAGSGRREPREGRGAGWSRVWPGERLKVPSILIVCLIADRGY